eukprot:2044673-Prymnesium_polylepis.2
MIAVIATLALRCAPSSRRRRSAAATSNLPSSPLARSVSDGCPSTRCRRTRCCSPCSPVRLPRDCHVIAT